MIDGHVGVSWDRFQAQLDQALRQQGVDAHWVSVTKALRPTEEIHRLIEPFLGDEDPIFDTRFSGTLSDFFDAQDLTLKIDRPASEMVIYFGTGAALITEQAYLVYVDVPKNEIQYRARAGSVHNLGEFLQPFILAFRADGLLITGGIAETWDRFAPFVFRSLSVPVLKGILGARAAILGAAALYF